MSEILDPLTHVSDAYDMDEYTGNPDLDRAVSQGMTLNPILWVEGPSDEAALGHYMTPLKFPLDIAVVKTMGPYMGARNAVIKQLLHYVPKKDGQQEYFSIDRDMDDVTEADLVEDAHHCLFYQMCEKGRKKGYNDLECFLFSSSVLNDIVTDAFGLDKRYVDNIRQQVVEAASFVGSLRAASRYVKKKVWGNVLNYRRPCFDPFEGGHKSTMYRYGEIDCRFFFEKGLAVAHEGVIEIDYDRCYDVIRQYCIKGDGSNADAVEEALEIATELQEEMNQHGHRIDYCRGHDITYLLARLLNGIDGCPPLNNAHELEDLLDAWQFKDAGFWEKFCEEIKKIEIFRTFMR